MANNNETYEERLKKASDRLNFDNRVRVGSFIAATFIAAVFYVGMTYAPESTWFQTLNFPIICILFVLVAIIVISTVLKFFFIAAYNRVIKQHQKGEI